MITIKSDRIIYVDVDDTLIGWESVKGDDDYVEIDCEGIVQRHKVLWENVRQLKKHKARGHAVVVWSQGGYKWAEAVVKALNLEPLVDAVMCKPTWVLDDLPPSAWMPLNHLASEKSHENKKAKA